MSTETDKELAERVLHGEPIIGARTIMMELARRLLARCEADKFKVSGVYRLEDIEKALLVFFDRKPTNDDMRDIHDHVVAMRSRAEGVAEEFKSLYKAVDRLVAYIGANGEISSSHEYASLLLDSIYACDKFMSAAPSPGEKCRKCGSGMKPGKALDQTFHTSREGTMSPGGPGVLIDCMKCVSCGWSVKGENE